MSTLDYRRQLAAVLDGYGERAACLLDELDPIEQLYVRQEQRLRWLTTPPLRVEALDDGSERRYVGRVDGVYVQVVSARGVPGELVRHCDWAAWETD